jgi:hypothetical protein
MRPTTLRALLVLFAAAVGFAGQAQTNSSANIAATDVYIAGSSLALEDVTATTGINIPVSLQTSFGGLKNEQAPVVPELTAVGDLTGPGLASPIQLQTAPGHAFTIPGLQAEGVYLLQNVRLMRGATFVQSAVPSSATITVADVLKTKVSVRQLTAAELRARGIQIDARNFDVYEYTLSFFIGDKEVLVPFPVVVDRRTHEIRPINAENPYTLPGFKGPQAPPRWGPPTVSPMELADPSELPAPTVDDGEPAAPPHPHIPAAIVIPNSLGVLHDFFAVALDVTNNAPAGSTITLDSVTATLKNPPELRVADTKPQVAFGRPLQLTDPNTGATILVAQAKSEVNWTLEALKTGTHTFSIDVNATYKSAPDAEAIPLHGSVSQQIIVHDPRFNVTFSHPDVVRAGLTYSTFTFVTNMTPSIQTIRLRTDDELPACSLGAGASVCRLDDDINSIPLCSGDSSVDLCRPSDDLHAQELTLKPGATRTLVYKLRSSLTGNVFATAGSVDSDVVHASVQLHMGVSQSGIPLSPATLVMPYYAQYVDAQFVTDNLQLLGLGYSLATAPLNQTTAKFPRVITTDVFRRAVDISRAGQRMFIGEDKRDTLANLTLDLLGNGPGNKLEEWDQLRRSEYSGRIAGASLGRQLEAASLKTAGDFDAFLARFGQTTAHRAPYLVAVTHGAPVAGNARPYAISLRGTTTNATMDVPNELATETSTGTRNIAFGDLTTLTAGDKSQTGEMAAVGIASETYELTVTPVAGSSFAVDVLYPSATAAHIRHVVIPVSNASGKPLAGVLDPASGTVTLTESGGSASYSGNASDIGPAPLAIVAAHQDMHLDDDGHKLAVLFNRPILNDGTVDYKPKFSGRVIFNQGSISYTGPRGVDAAAVQDDDRTLYLTFDHSLSKNATYTMQVQPITDPISNAPVSFADVTPVLENDRPAGIIYGRVLRGDNTPVPNAQVILNATSMQYDTSSSDKAAFLFEYVLRDLSAGVGGAYELRAIDSDGKSTHVNGAVRLTGVVETVNLVYLGRGSAEGRVTYDNGEVVPNATVVVGSTLFNQFRSTTTAADGTYRVTDLPVGPLTFSAKDAAGNTTFAASEVRSAGQVVKQDLSIYRQPFPGVGTIRGVVLRSDTNQPVPNAHVGVYSQGYGLTDGYTDVNGRFEFDKVPTGLVTALASEWSVSLKAVGIDFELSPDQVKDLTLTLEVNPSEPLANLEGDVEEEDPANPGVYHAVPNALVQIDKGQVITADPAGHFVFTSLGLSTAGKDLKAYDPATQRRGQTVVPTLDPTKAAYARVPITVSNAYGTGTLRVRVLDAGGNPVSSYSVLEPGYPPVRFTPVGDGAYELKNVPVGQSAEIWAIPSDTSRLTFGEQMAHTHLGVAFNGQTAFGVMRLPGQGKLRVRLLTDIVSIGDVNVTYPKWSSEEQQPMPNTVTLSTKDPATGQAGYAVFDKVPVGGVGVYAALAGFGYDSKDITMAYDGQVIDVDLQAKKLASIAGVVYAIDGQTPLSGVPVRMTDGAQNQGPQPTQLDGSFKFGNVAAAAGFTVTAETTAGGIYRVGRADGSTPRDGGPVTNVAVVMKQQGSVEGFVVYSGYKVFNPTDPSKNVLDDTPNDPSDNARVPLAQFYLRELSFPYRSFGKNEAPLTADITGHFILNNIFAGPVRATAWSQSNQDLRGDGQTSVDQEGATATVYVQVGTQGFGPVAITVVDPNNQNQPVENAEVTLGIPMPIGPPRVFDFGTTDANGIVRFDQVPVGTYLVDAFSKAVGKSGSVGNVSVQAVTGATVLVPLQFSGSVNGTLSDPEAGGAGVPGIPVILSATGYQQQTSTTTTGSFFIGGVHEGTFLLDAMQETSRRRAHAQGAVSAADPNPTVNMQLEATSPLYVKVFYPNDDGSMSNVEVPVSDVHVKQRCRPVIGGEICEYTRDLQGSGLVFTSLFASDAYSVGVHEVGGDARSTGGSGRFPVGATADNPFKLTLPAFGTVQVTVRQPGTGGVLQPAVGARVGVANQTVTTDATGVAVAHGIPLGDLSVNAVSFDGLFSAYSPTVHLGSQSTPLQVTLDLGAYAGVSGKVIAELGGPSVNTRVVASWPGHSATLFTDATGAFKFQGIAVNTSGPTGVSLTYFGPDDTTVGAAQSVTLTSANASQVVAVPDVTLDATPPSVISVSPADNSVNVSPDSSILVVFSEPILPTTINNGNFQLIATDGTPQVQVSFATDIDPATGQMKVTMLVPQPTDPAQRFPLKSNMLYKVTLTSGITDLRGHPLPQRAFSFITADYVAPKVTQLEPLTSVPLSASTTFAVHFNKPLASQLFNASHNIVAPLEVHLYKLTGPGGSIAAEKPGSAYGDLTNTIVSFAPSDPLEEKSYYRLTLIGVRDTVGNVADPISFDYFSFDKTPPFITFDPLPVPAGSPLVSGVRYTLKTLLRDGSATADPATDVSRVDFFQVVNGAKTLLASVSKAPFDYSFTAPTVTAQGSITFHVEARDTSFNDAVPQEITFPITQNLPPQNVKLTLATPDPIYAGTTVSATPSLDDEGVLVTLQAQLTGTNADGTPYASSRIAGQATRAKSGDPFVYSPAAFAFTLPTTLQDGSTATITLTAADGVNDIVTGTPATFTVAPDTNPPAITSLTVSPASPYHLGDTYTITAVVKDLETGVSDVAFNYDGITQTLKIGDPGVTAGSEPRSFKFALSVKVPAKNDDTRIPIVATARDYRGNKSTSATEVTYIGVHDATLPKGAWVSPIANAAWPSDQAAFTTTLRVWAQDDQAITGVQFQVPGLANAVTATAAANNLYTAQVTIPTPAAGSAFTISALVSDADPSHTQTITIPITLVKIDTTLGPSFTQAITSTTDALAGKSVLVQGPNAHLVMHVPFTFKNLIVLDGGSVETLGTTTSTERKLDVTVSDTLYVDSTSIIDVAGKGYLGGWALNPDSSGTRSDDARGRTIGNTVTGGPTVNAAASHGGVGAEYGGTTNRTYDSITAPSALGTGGAGAATCCGAGGVGGGAAALTGGNGSSDLGRLVIAGTIRADGTGGVSGGSGGSIRMSGKMVAIGRNGRITANGADEGSFGNATRGAGGGRIAVTASEVLSTDDAQPQLQARGGRNSAGEGATQVDGGAGTVFVRRPGETRGELLVSAYDDRYPSTTHQTRATIAGYTGSGTSTAITANTLTDSTRTFVPEVVGEDLILGGDTSKSYTITAVSADGHTLTTDAADGALPTTSQTVAYAGLIAFDVVKVSDRALLRVDDAIAINGAIDDATKASVTAPALMVLRNNVPQITAFSTTPAAGGNLIRGSSFTTSYTATSTAGVGSASLAFSPVATPAVDSFFDYATTATKTNRAINVPSDAALGAATLTLTVTDRAGRQASAPAAAFTVIENTAPSITQLDVAPASLYPGHNVTATISANDDIAVTKITVTSTIGNNAPSSQTATPNTQSVTALPFTLSVPITTPGGSPMSVDVTAEDNLGNKSTQSNSVTILKDANPPSVTITSPTPNQLIQEQGGVNFTVKATASDAEVGIKAITVKVGDAAPVAMVPDSGVTNGFKADVPIPNVDGVDPVTIPITVTAADYEGNPATASINILEQPLYDPNGPVVSFLCPTGDALLPPNYTTKLRAYAIGNNVGNNTNVVTKVEFYVNNATTSIVASAVSGLANTYEATYAIPAGAAEGDVYTVRVVATNTAGKQSDATTHFTIATGTVITADRSVLDASLDNQTVIVQSGTLTLGGARTFTRLLVLDGARVTHLPVNTGGKLTLTVTGITYVSCTGTIDANGLGYATNTSYSGATVPADGSGGSHIGIGGLWNTALGSTFGNVEHPADAGGGGAGGAATNGGGIIRLTTGTLAADGVVRANGTFNSDRSAAGGSVWITATTLNGSGSIQANGGDANSNYYSLGAGAGGAIAIDYTNSSGKLLANAVARTAIPGGNYNRAGGGGTIVLRGPGSTFGDLIVDNKGYAGQLVDLPALGSGTAQAGSSGATLVTDRGTAIPAYFAGHWIEISDASGNLKGTWAIATINNKTVTLTPNASETISVQQGDKWQGVYRFDHVSYRNGESVRSNDPIRIGVNGSVTLAGPTTAGQYLELPYAVSGNDVTITGNVSVTAINAATLTVKNGAVLTVPLNGSAPNTLTLNVSNSITVENGGAIDVSGRGYAPNLSYPGATTPGDASGGSHIGLGGVWNAVGSSFGSVYRPREAGGGAGNRGNPYGGGVLRIITATLQNDGAIRANGIFDNDRSGAGGSIWITATNLNGNGTVDADGGDNNGNYYSLGAGAGGAIAVEYTNSSGTILTKLTARAGTPGSNYNRGGGAGTVYLKSPSSTYGTVIIDNKASGIFQPTDLPSFGSGVAQSGSSGATLVTDRSANIPAYFEGHWIEISDSTGNLKGTWRVATISSKTVTLTPNGNETISVQPGDKWQGVYRFDVLNVPGATRITGADPIRIGVNGNVVINGPTGNVTLDLPYSITGTDVSVTGNVILGGSITATNSVTINAGQTTLTGITAPALTVKSGATLTAPTTNAPTTLTLNVSNSITIENGGAIDVSGRGYAPNLSYPGATTPGDASGGSHIGLGGVWNAVGSSFGSVYRPREAGGGAGNRGNPYGGGVLRIITATLQNDGAIRANGIFDNDRSGAGGSIWITATNLNGNGTVDADGGDNNGNYYSLGAGGGGAIAVEYTNTTGTILTKLTARAGTPGSNYNRGAGAGTVYVKTPSSTYGTVTIDNKGSGIVQPTDLPSLGSGVAQSGSSGATLVTDRSANIPAYFEGHWIEISDASGNLKGTWRVATISSKTVTLTPNGNETISVQPGDKWQGVYRFDVLNVPGATRITGADPIRIGVNGNVVINGPTGNVTLDLPYSITGTDVSVTGNVILGGSITATNSVTINAGQTTLTGITAPALTVKSGATITTPTTNPPATLTLNVSNSITIENGGAIDVSGRGYAPNVSYPGATTPGDASGGSHIGLGGVWNAVGSSFGSVYRPREAGGGAGNRSYPYGGGVIRIITATLQNDGAIRANGVFDVDRSGAGGSIWITATNVNGNGTVDADGADTGGNYYSLGAGGGGAIAVEYTNTSGTILTKLTARAGTAGGNYNRQGGAGTVYLKSPSSTYGDVIIDNKSSGTSQLLDLPSLGGGTAQNGSSGTTLMTDRTTNIPAYFEGHWVEISTSAGTLKGTWRIATINGKAAVLAPNGSETIDVQPGDKWQGVYHFDTLRAVNGEAIRSLDPIRLGVNGVITLAGPATAGQYLALTDPINATTVTLTGNVIPPPITATTVTIKSGAVISTAVNGSAPNNVTLNATGTLTIESGALIDVTGRGYAPNASYAGATTPGDASGGAHIGVGGLWSNPLGTSFGSVYRPREAGGGAGNRSNPYGGGIVRLTAGTLQLDGAIRANGVFENDRSGAGGSVWITATTLAGDGTVDANGADVNGNYYSLGAGGGGAIAVEYTNASGTVLSKLTARSGLPGGNYNRPGGAGSVYVKGGSSTYGDLTIDNKTSAAGQLTELQALGIGIAQAGSSGATLVTDRATNIPAYFEGHWVNITDANGAAKGSWRIAAISNKSVTLAPNGSETISIVPGDKWRGSYKLDHLTLKNCTFRTADLVELGNPVSVTSSTYVFGNVAPPSIDTTKISIQATATGFSVVGTAGAVSDPEPPIGLTLLDATTGATFTGTAVSDGSFAVGVQGNAGDTIQIKAKDSHLYPLESAYATVGTLPGSTPTVTQINVSTWTTDAQFQPRTLAVEGTTLAIASRISGSTGQSDKVVILDISDPARPVLKRVISTGSRVLDIRIANGWLFVANNRFSAFNLADPNSTQVLTGDPSGDDYSLVVSGGYAFTGEEGWNNDGRINVYDVSNPAAPRFLSQQVGGMSNTAYNDLLAYGTDYLIGISSWGSGRDVVVIDRRNPNAMVKVGELQIPNFDAFRGVISGNNLYLLDGGHAQMVVVDLTNPAAPAVAGTLPLPTFGWGADVVTSDVFVADDASGVVSTTADPAHLQVTGGAATSGPAWDVVVQSGYAYVAHDKGLAIIPVNVAPVIRTSLITMSLSGTTVSINGAARAVTGGTPAITLVDTATSATVSGLAVNADGSFSASLPAAPGDPITITATNGKTNGPLALGLVPFSSGSSFIAVANPNNDGNWRARMVRTEGNNLLLGSFPDGAGDSDKLVLYDISNPAAPVLKRAISTGIGRLLDIQIVNGFAYVAGNRFGTIDLNSATSTMNLTGDPSGNEYGLAVAGGYAFTGEVDWNNDGRINIYDVSNPAAPRFVRQTGGFMGGTHYFSDLLPYGTDYLVAISRTNGTAADVVVIDRRNVNNLVKVGSVSLGTVSGFRGRLAGNKLYVGGYGGSYGGGAAIVDLSNPTAPAVIATQANSTTMVRGVDLSASTLAAASGTSVAFYDVSSNTLRAIGTQPVAGTAWDVSYGRGALYVAADTGFVVLADVAAPPVIDTRQIRVGASSATMATIAGGAAAVSGHGPFTAQLRDTTSGATISATIAADGSFTASLPATPGDALTLTVTDANNRTAGPSLLGTMPFGTAVTTVPVVNPNGDTGWRARMVRVEGNNLLLGPFPDEGVGNSDKLVLYDVSNPAAPVQKRVIAPFGYILDVQIVNGWAYIAGNRFGTIDLTNPSSTVNLTGDPSGDEYGLAIAGGYAFTGEIDWNNDGRINIYDVSNPAAPRYLRQTGGFMGGTHYFSDLLPYGDNYLVAISRTNGTAADVVVIDRRNVNNLVKVGSVSLGSISGFRGRIVGSKLYVGGYSGGSAIVDLTNPAAPVVVATQTATSMTRGLDISGATLAAPNGSAGVTFYDVSGGTFVATGTQPTGGVAWDAAFQNANLYVANDEGLVVIQNVVAPPVIDTRQIGVTSDGTNALVHGNAAAITGLGSLSVDVKDTATSAVITIAVRGDGSFDATLPASAGDAITVKATDGAGRTAGPVVVGTVPFGTAVTVVPVVNPNGDTGWRARMVRVEGNNLLLGPFPDEGVGNSDKLVLYDVSNPAAPVQKRVIAPFGYILDVQIVNGWAYIAGNRFGTIDLTNPSSTVNLTGDPSGNEYGLAVAGGYAFTGEIDWNTDGRINIYDVSNPAAPRYLRQTGGFMGYPHYFSDLLPYGNNYLVGICRTNGTAADVVVIDRRDVNNLVKVGSVSLGSVSGFRGRIVGNRLYVGGYSGGSAIVDLTNPAAPAVIASSSDANLARGLDLAGTTMALANGAQGVAFYDVSADTLRSIGTQPTGGVAWDAAFGNGNLYVANDEGFVIVRGLGVAPDIKPALISLTATASGATIAGSAHAIGGNGTTTLGITDTTTGASVSGIAVNADGSFSTSVVAKQGDKLSLTATDAAGRTSTRTLGVAPFFNVATDVRATRDDDGGMVARHVLTDGTNTVISTATNFGYAGGSGNVELYLGSPTATPVLFGATGGAINDIFLRGTWLYVGGDSFSTLDLSASPLTRHASNGDPSGRDMAVAVIGNYAFTAEGAWNDDARLNVYDVTNPAAPVFVRQQAWGNTPTDFYQLIPYNAQYLIALTSDKPGVNGDVSVFDVSNINSIARVKVFDIPNFNGIYGMLDGTTLYVAGFNAATNVAIVDLSNPQNPVLKSTVATPGIARNIAVSGTNEIVVADASGLTFVDVTDKTKPVVIGTQQVNGTVRDVKVIGKTLYVATETRFLTLQRP